MSQKQIITVPFTGKRTVEGWRGQEWYDHRYKIFTKYTLNSLKNQTDKDFFLWICFRPEEKHNPTTHKLRTELDEAKLDYLMTFDGINFTDDKVPERNKDLLERLTKMYKEVPMFQGNIYETMLDSDDTLHKDFVKTIKQIPFKEKGAIILKEGYIYSTNDRLAKWYNPTSNQNYTIMFPNKTYYNPKKRLDYLDGLKTHEEVPEKFDCVELKDMYCSITHGNNMSTEWGHPFQREEIYNESIKNELLKNYV
jgi:hypothetical protein